MFINLDTYGVGVDTIYTGYALAIERYWTHQTTAAPEMAATQGEHHDDKPNNSKSPKRRTSSSRRL